MNAAVTENSRRDRRVLDPQEADDGVRRYYDPRFKAMIVKVFPGEHYVTNKPEEMLVTVLGSCVAACIRDTLLCIGGMNHFMLAESSDGKWGQAAASMRYGNFAMEQLINDILSRGGKRERLEIKVFGGGNVLKSNTLVGSDNADFVEHYLREEKLPIAAKHLRGEHPRRVHYWATTGKVMMLELKRNDDLKVLKIEETYKSSLVKQEVGGDVELFS